MERDKIEDKLEQLKERLTMFQKIVHRIKEEINQLKEKLKKGE